jgi:uncharacterized membrane protein YkoI
MRFVIFCLAQALSLDASFAQSSACFSDWSAAAAVVKSEGLVTLDELTKLAPSKFGGEIVRSALCESEKGHVYRLTIRDANGRLMSVVVDAKHPF